ncbi:MAG: hypothetical protein AB7Q29_13530 [Vicinamibacterales bacterium]
MAKDLAELFKRFWQWLTNGGAKQIEAALKALGVDDDLKAYITHLAREAETTWTLTGLEDVIMRREINGTKREWVVQVLVDKGIPTFLARPAVELVVQLLKAQGILPKSTSPA